MRFKVKVWLYPVMSLVLLLATTSCNKDEDGKDEKGWSVLGGMDDINAVYDMHIDEDGNVYAVGGFMDESGDRYVGKWDGNTWSKVGDLNINDNILTITGDHSGNLYIGGLFRDGYDNNTVLKWDGSGWSDIGFIGAEQLLWTFALMHPEMFMQLPTHVLLCTAEASGRY